MKKLLTVALAAAIAVLAGCASNSQAPASSGSGTPGAVSSAPGFDLSRDITVVSREDGSGTRGAFIELTGVEQKDAAGNKSDMTTEEAVTVSSTSVVMTTVAQNPYAIGYISLGSLNDTVKALSVENVLPSVATVKDGSYKIARPFNIAKSAGASAASDDFIRFILSADGQSVVEKNGYISKENTGAFAGTKPAGKIVVAGSSSVTPVMEKLKEAYLAVNPSAEIEIQMSDSTTGMNSAIEGICDIGMASRELKSSEIEKGLSPIVIAMDGIAVVVNNQNSVKNLSIDQIMKVFTGQTTKWSSLA